MTHICPKCDKKLYVHRNGQKVNKIFKCHECGKVYQSQKGFLKHWQGSHRLEKNETKSAIRKCLIYKSDFPVNKVTKHFADEHNLEIEEENYVFPDEQSIKKWKKTTEKTTSSMFTLRYCSQYKKTTNMYRCHCSGSFNSESKGIRHMKSQEYRKINAFCPASLCVVNSKDYVLVKYTKTHIGHSNDVCHLDISPIKKDEITSQLMEKVPKRAILRKFAVLAVVN